MRPLTLWEQILWRYWNLKARIKYCWRGNHRFYVAPEIMRQECIYCSRIEDVK